MQKRNIPLFKVFMSKDMDNEILEVIHSGFIGQGPVVEKFEEDLKSWFDNDLVLTVNSGTSAEHLAIHLLKQPTEYVESLRGSGGLVPGKWEGIEDGDEVLATPLTCTATNFPILANNLKIKWVDVDPNTMNMDLDDLARKITAKTKVIMLVHWGGYPVDLDRVREIQLQALRKFGTKPVVIEDCAHAFGSTYKKKKLGNHGNICTFSFQAIKHMTSVDGGALVLPHLDLYNRAKLMRWYGIDRETNKKDFRCEENIKEWGFKFHMNDVNATIGRGNLLHIDNILSTHRENARFYNEALKDIEGITLLENKDDRESAYWLYTIKVDKRDEFMAHMKKCGIATSKVHERNDKHTCVWEFNSILPNLDKVVKEMICLPVGWWVTAEDREFIVDCIKKGW